MATAKNDITGDSIQTRAGLSDAGQANWDKIFPPKKKERYIPPPLVMAESITTPAESPEYAEDWQSSKRDKAISQNGNNGEHYINDNA